MTTTRYHDGRMLYLHGSRWNLLLLLLSMDLIEPFRKMIGLEIAEMDRVRTVLRQEILDSLVEMKEKEGLPGFVPRSLKKLAETMGEPAFLALVHWSRAIFFEKQSDFAEHRIWQRLLTLSLEQEPCWYQLGFGEAHAARFKVLFRDSLDTRDFAVAADKVRNAMFSDWDLCIFLERRFSLDPDTEHGPLFWLEGSLNIYRQRQFWDSVLAVLDEQERTELACHASLLCRDLLDLDGDELPVPSILGGVRG